MASEEREAITGLDRLTTDKTHDEINLMGSRNKKEKEEEDDSSSSIRELKKEETRPAIAYAEGDELLIENAEGDVIGEAVYNKPIPKKNEENKPMRSGLSNLKKIFLSKHEGQLDGERRHSTKYYAYKIDNQLIIEDDEGEVLRRYKIRTHSDKKDATGGHGSLLQKALAILGIKNNHSQTATPATASDSVPNDSYRHVDGGENGKVGAGEEEQETTVEKERRLSALGYPSAPRNKDAEEEPPISLEHGARITGDNTSTTKGTKNSLEKKLHLK